MNKRHHNEPAVAASSQETKYGAGDTRDGKQRGFNEGKGADRTCKVGVCFANKLSAYVDGLRCNGVWIGV